MEHASLTKGKVKFEWMLMTSLLLSHHIETASKQKRGERIVRGLQELHAIPEVDNDSLLRLLSSQTLLT